MFRSSPLNWLTGFYISTIGFNFTCITIDCKKTIMMSPGKHPGIWILLFGITRFLIESCPCDDNIEFGTDMVLAVILVRICACFGMARTRNNWRCGFVRVLDLHTESFIRPLVFLVVLFGFFVFCFPVVFSLRLLLVLFFFLVV